MWYFVFWWWILQWTKTRNEFVCLRFCSGYALSTFFAHECSAWCILWWWFFFLYGSGMDILILLLLSYNSITKSKNCLLFHEANIKPLHSRSGQRANSIAATHNTLNGLGWPFAANAINFGNKKQNEHNNNNSRDDEWEMEMKQEWKTNQNLLTDNLKANWNVRCSVKYSPLLTMSCSAQFPICLWIWFFFCSCSD